MKHHLIKPLLALLLATGLHHPAQAAYFDYVSHLGSGGYSAVTNGVSVDHAVSDLSSPPADVALFGAKSFSAALVNGALEHSYAADAFLGFSTLGTDLAMSLSHSLVATATGALSVTSHQQDAFVDLTSVTLVLTGGAGEAMGSDMIVSFQGVASALYDFSGQLGNAHLGLGLSVLQGTNVMGEYLWDVTQTGEQDVAFSFIGKVGEAYTLSAYMLSGAVLAESAFAAIDSPITLVDAGAQLSGTLSVTAVPEPETFALLLVGLGVVACQVRRRRSAT